VSMAGALSVRPLGLSKHFRRRARLDQRLLFSGGMTLFRGGIAISDALGVASRSGRF
jgi:hypothetical protein